MPSSVLSVRIVDVIQPITRIHVHVYMCTCIVRMCIVDIKKKTFVYLFKNTDTYIKMDLYT